MKKIESGDGATALNVDIDKVADHLTPGEYAKPEPMDLRTGVPHDPWANPQPSGGLFPSDPITARRLDDLERRIKALEVTANPERLKLEQERAGG